MSATEVAEPTASAPTAAPVAQAEREFAVQELFFSTTNAKGIIESGNRVFARVAAYEEQELIGRAHSIIRHPDMPRCVFKLLWDTIQARKEIFAYVKNMAKNGDHYWVLAHVTPSFDANGAITGFHSNRRSPERSAVAQIEPLYRKLLTEEARHENKKDGMIAAHDQLTSFLTQQDLEYDQFVFSTIEQAA